MLPIEWSQGIEEARNDVDGIWAARDRFWPAVYDQVASESSADAEATEN